MLESLTLQFDPVEDRLELRLREQQQGQPLELVLHLTRRLCLGLSDELSRLVQQSAQPPQHLQAPAREAIAAAHHEALAAQAARAPAGQVRAPAQQRRLLVTGFQSGRTQSQTHWVLRFAVRDATAVTLSLSPPTLHALIDLFGRKLGDTGWGISAPLRGPASQTLAGDEVLRQFH